MSAICEEEGDIPVEFCTCESETDANDIRDDQVYKCQLCGDELGDVFLACVIFPWGDTCGKCVEEIRQLKEVNK